MLELKDYFFEKQDYFQARIHAVPFGALLNITGLVFEKLIGRHTQAYGPVSRF